MSTANSSPPRRATVSPARVHCTSRCAKARSSWSPGAVAEAVVHGLEIVEIDEQHARRHAVGNVPDRLVTRSANSERLASSVSGSWKASVRSWSFEPRGVRDVRGY
jgi:hypothetical protein